MAGGIINYVQMLDRKPVGVTVRRWRAIRHEANRRMGEYWHKHMLPQHFAPNARYVYGYQPRKAEYLARKQRAATRGRDGRRIVQTDAAGQSLVYSGTLKHNVLSVATIRTFEKRFKLVMPGTPYTPDRPRRATQPPIAREVTRLLVREQKELAKIAKAYAKEELNRAVTARTTKIG